MKKIEAIIIISIIASVALAQKPSIKFDRQLHDFGQVQSWNNPPAYFLFTNAGKTDMLFLPTRQREDIFVELPKGNIKAGQSDTVVVYYFTDKTGEFQQSVELYTSTSGAPVQLTVKGNILSLDAKAYISCPGFAPKMERTDDLALLLDSLSGKSTQVPKTTPAQRQATPPAQNHAPPPVEAVMEFEEAEEEVQTKAPEQEQVTTTTIQPATIPTRIEAPAVEDSKLLPQRLYAPNNIIFLIDISGSMKKSDKLPLLKISMKNLTGVLRKIDYLSVIVYSTTSTVLMRATPADKKEEIVLLIDTLKTHGITNGVKGLQTAYDMAKSSFIPGGNNQVIIATDGIFNSPSFTEGAIYSMVRENADDDIILSVVGFGDDRDAIRMMKKMAERGNGSFIQIPDKLAADEILIEEIKMQSAIGN